MYAYDQIYVCLKMSVAYIYKCHIFCLMKEHSSILQILVYFTWANI